MHKRQNKISKLWGFKVCETTFLQSTTEPRKLSFEGFTCTSIGVFIEKL